MTSRMLSGFIEISMQLLSSPGPRVRVWLPSQKSVDKKNTCDHDRESNIQRLVYCTTPTIPAGKKGFGVVDTEIFIPRIPLVTTTHTVSELSVSSTE